MVAEEHNPIECRDCGETPVLVETPYADDGAYAVVCECGSRGIDVSGLVNGNSLVEPISGKWSNIDHDTRIGSGDPR